MIAHNGEINTYRENINWMAARQIVMESFIMVQELKRMLPIIMEGQSDTCNFDTVRITFAWGKKSPHAVMMMIPEAWSKMQQWILIERHFMNTMQR